METLDGKRVDINNTTGATFALTNGNNDINFRAWIQAKSGRDVTIGDLRPASLRRLSIFKMKIMSRIFCLLLLTGANECIRLADDTVQGVMTYTGFCRFTGYNRVCLSYRCLATPDQLIRSIKATFMPNSRTDIVSWSGDIPSTIYFGNYRTAVSMTACHWIRAILWIIPIAQGLRMDGHVMNWGCCYHRAW